MKNRTLLLMLLVMSVATPVSSLAEQPSKTKENFQEGTVEIVNRCIMVISNSIVRVTDYDMNQDSKKIEEFDIEVWSDYDNRLVEYTVIETDVNTGIFEGVVFFTTTDDSPGKRIRTVQDSIVFAKYVDYTLPNEDKEMEITDKSSMSELPTYGWRGDDDQWKVTYDPCTAEHLDKNRDWLRNIIIYYPAPLKQIKSGLILHEVKCKENLVLLQKYDGSPACVTESTKTKLVERGWSISANTSLDTKNESYLFKSTNALGEIINTSPVGMPIHFYYNLTNSADEKYLYNIDFGIFSPSGNVYNNTKSVEVPASKSIILAWEFTPQMEDHYIASVRDNYGAYATVKHIIAEDPNHHHDKMTVTILSGASNSDCKETCVVPKVLTIPTDTIVDFINTGPEMHKISTGNVEFGPDDTFHISYDGRFQSPYLSTNETYSFLFLTPGEYKYYSWIQPQISGTIYVVSDDDIENEN